jgi:hypothetical protein
MPTAAPAPKGGTETAAAARKISPALVAGIGGGVTLAVVIAVAMMGQSGPSAAGQPELALVAQADLDGAAATLAPQAAPALEAEAKSCTTPLASVVLSKATTGAAGAVRVRSGDYVSPSFTLTDAPQRVAIPYPAPYLTGKGIIAIEGNATDAVIGLAPAQSFATLAGSAPIQVWWTPKKPC